MREDKLEKSKKKLIFHLIVKKIERKKKSRKTRLQVSFLFSIERENTKLKKKILYKFEVYFILLTCLV